MRFLLDQLRHDRTDDDGTEVYLDEAGRLIVRVDAQQGRAEIVAGEHRAVLVRDADGLWAPTDWPTLARVLDAPALALACLGF